MMYIWNRLGVSVVLLWSNRTWLCFDLKWQCKERWDEQKRDSCYSDRNIEDDGRTQSIIVGDHGTRLGVWVMLLWYRPRRLYFCTKRLEAKDADEREWWSSILWQKVESCSLTWTINMRVAWEQTRGGGALILWAKRIELFFDSKYRCDWGWGPTKRVSTINVIELSEVMVGCRVSVWGTMGAD